MLPRDQSEEMQFGFTLTEWLVVVLLMGVLASLVLSISGGVFRKGNRVRAVVELNAITVALENYRQQFGDYPDVASGRQLFDALAGKLGPKGQAMNRPFPPFLESGQFSLGDPDHPVLLDPWEQPYQYQYLEPVSAASQSGYRIFSKGPDQLASLAGDRSSQEDADNIWPDD